jgi:hypothetical protein
MLCDVCLHLFRAYHRCFVKDSAYIPHQLSAETVHGSASLGCAICVRLWEQYMTKSPFPGVKTVCIFRPVEDKVVAGRMRSAMTSEPASLSSSGFWYRIFFYWRSMEPGYSEDPDVIFNLEAAKSTYVVAIYLLRVVFRRDRASNNIPSDSHKQSPYKFNFGYSHFCRRTETTWLT